MIRGKFLLTGDPQSAFVYGIRKEVFVDELGFDAQSEIDAHDMMSVYALILDDDDTPSAAGRLYIEGDCFRIGKVCVLKNARGRYMGDLVMRMLLYKAQELNCTSVSLSAPVNTVGFFARYGLSPQGTVYEENGTAYREMR
ncbi:MAG: GNAT family N-acetyltransferase, partial [Oscillospiraceae bacterium]|nr:GNAT family N-acetyltransferase [Oscillospiraceae bacterium]